MKSLTKNNDGFISIIAIGIFALLMIFAISLQMTVIDTLQNLKNGQNYDSARDVADSTIEYLQDTLQKFSPGLNDSANCIFSGGALKTNDSSLVNPALCGQFAGIIGTKNANVSVIVKGRSATADKLKSSTSKCGAGDCYVTPTPGTGDAGANCDLYKPNSVANSNYVDSTLPAVSTTLDQVDYSCNWNKLTFGSSQTDRVAIPLYYDNGGLSGTTDIVNPYFGNAPKATKFYVRLRTPCKPCAPSNPTADQRQCDGTPLKDAKDPTVCADIDRYKLDAGGGVNGGTDDIVVQWLINGLCGTEACGLMPIADKTKASKPFSSLYESKIFNNNVSAPAGYPIVIHDKTDAYDTNNYPKTFTIINPVQADPDASINKLKEVTKPVLTLFLNKPLLTEPPLKSNIPYLEYQVLTDYPIGNSRSSLDVTVNVEGNNFHKTLTQEVQKALIDFAIHN
ncbi:MAG: hypothetical protein NTZ25_00890 [Candidatus Peregrinibacteria bacterium]|nr:hypothetical protein [Candidatus Peregrinibacteria bacterium]